MESKLGIRTCDERPEGLQSLLVHPIFAWLRLRPVFGQHSAREHAALKEWAAGRSSLVEIGVAEGASALALRQAMSPDATLYLIDPFHLSRYPRINATRRVAQRSVETCPKGRVVWIEKSSATTAKEWNRPVDFVFLDGDHSEPAVRRDWDDWRHFTVPDGVIVFHDARVFSGGWPEPDWGPVKVVNALFREHPLAEWKIVDEIDSLVVVQRRKSSL